MVEVMVIGEEADVRESIGGGCSASSHAKLGISYWTSHREAYHRCIAGIK